MSLQLKIKNLRLTSIVAMDAKNELRALLTGASLRRYGVTAWPIHWYKSSYVVVQNRWLLSSLSLKEDIYFIYATSRRYKIILADFYILEEHETPIVGSFGSAVQGNRHDVQFR